MGGSLIYEAAFFSLFPGTTVSHTRTQALLFFRFSPPFHSNPSHFGIILFSSPSQLSPAQQAPPPSSFPNSIPDMYNCCLQLLLFFAAVSKTRLFLQKTSRKPDIYFFRFSCHSVILREMVMRTPKKVTSPPPPPLLPILAPMLQKKIA